MIVKLLILVFCNQIGLVVFGFLWIFINVLWCVLNVVLLVVLSGLRISVLKMLIRSVRIMGVERICQVDMFEVCIMISLLCWLRWNRVVSMLNRKINGSVVFNSVGDFSIVRLISFMVLILICVLMLCDCLIKLIRIIIVLIIFVVIFSFIRVWVSMQ